MENELSMTQDDIFSEHSSAVNLHRSRPIATHVKLQMKTLVAITCERAFMVVRAKTTSPPARLSQHRGGFNRQQRKHPSAFRPSHRSGVGGGGWWDLWERPSNSKATARRGARAEWAFSQTRPPCPPHAPLSTTTVHFVHNETVLLLSGKLELAS